MAVNDQRGARWDHVAVEGCDFSATVTAVDSNAAAINLSAATVTATIYNTAGTAIDQLSAVVSGTGSNIITLSMTDGEIDALVDAKTWSLVITRSGAQRAWFAGSFIVSAADRARSTSGTSVTATVDTNVVATATVSASALASEVSITDTGDYYTGTNVETALQEVGSLKAPKASPALTGTPTAPTAATDTSTTQIATTAYVRANRTAQAAVDAAQYAPIGAPTAAVPLVIPTYDDDPSITHLDVVHIEGGWNGYPYWMAFTPYPDSARENPSIVASRDGVTWVVPDGLTNPIVTRAQSESDYGANAFNADTDLVYDPDTGKLICFYKVQLGGSAIYRIESSDGVTWTNRIEVIDTTLDSILSPAVVIEDDGTWTMWSIDRTVAAPYAMTRRTSADDGITWSSPDACTVTGNVLNKWHVDVVLFGGRYFALLNTTSPSRLTYLTSSDGVTWTGTNDYIVPLVDTVTTGGVDYTDGGHYRSTFLPVPGDPLRWDVWAATRRTAAGEWRAIYYRSINLTAERYVNEFAAAVTVPHANNAWYVTPHASTQSATLGAGNMRTTPIYLPACTIDEIGLEITGAVASSVGRVGIYADNGKGTPGALLATGTVNTASAAAFVFASITALTLDGGLYHLAFHADTASSGIGYRATNAGQPVTFPQPIRPASTAFSGGLSGFIQQSIVAGAMPTTFVSAGRSPATPIMWVHTATNSTSRTG